MADIEVGEAGWRDEAFRESGKGKSFVFFYDRAVKNTAKSIAQGRPIFDNRVMIKKLVPGDSRLVIDTYAREPDFEAFPVEYARYQQKKEARPSGTPLEFWPALTDMQKAEFRALNIFTVEQFASLPDGASEKIMGLNELRKKARAFVLAQEAGEKLVEAQEKMKADAEEKAEQARIIKELTERLAAIEAGAGREKLGLPKKQAAA